jgi:heme oxygenase
MLGGQHVARALEQDLGLGADRLTYLRPAGDAVGQRWARFVAALDAFGVSATARQWRTAEAGAHAAFDAFAEAFRREALI